MTAPSPAPQPADGEREAYVHPKCVSDGHNWQSWFYSTRTDTTTRVCARWNCTGREEINPVGMVTR